MPMRLASKRDKTTALRSSVTVNYTNSYVWPIPYGKGTVTISGRGGTGDAAYNNPSYVAQNSSAYYYVVQYGNTDTVVDQPSTTYYVVDQNSNTYYVVDQPGQTISNYDGTYVEEIITWNPDGYQDYAYMDYYDHTCPSPSYSYKFYYHYYCEDRGTSYTNPTYYRAVSNPTYYRAVSNPTYYKQVTNSPNYAVAYNPTYYNPSYTNPTNTGAAMNIAGTTFPGGYGGAGPYVSTTIKVPYSNSGLSIVVPSGGYVNIVVST